jgi:hypothetical protein
MDVIDPNLSFAFRENAWRESEKCRRADEFTPRQHAGA